MSLDDIWDEPVASPAEPAPAGRETIPLKRPRQSLFLSDSDSDYERPPKRATPAPPSARPDVDALFDDLDKDGDGDVEDDSLRYKPLAPALDLAQLAKEAEARHARAKQAAPARTLPSISKQPESSGGNGKDQSARAEGKDDGENMGRKKLPKLDEERLVGPEGFLQLIKDTRGFKPKGKGHEHTDLNRLLQVYQFWTHRMYPKTSFKDTINRVQKLCHSKRMQVRLSVWRDEAKGVANGKKLADDRDVIDLTEPTLVGTEDDGNDKESEHSRPRSNRASSHPPSFPPATSEADDFDIEVEIRAEEKRLAALRAMTIDSGMPQTSLSPNLAEKTSYGENPGTDAMDVDEASLWDAFDDPQPDSDPAPSFAPSTGPVGEDEDMWDIVNEIEGGEQSRPSTNLIPVSGVNLMPSLETGSSGIASRATNDDDWDEMYS